MKRKTVSRYTEWKRRLLRRIKGSGIVFLMLGFFSCQTRLKGTQPEGQPPSCIDDTNEIMMLDGEMPAEPEAKLRGVIKVEPDHIRIVEEE